MKYCLIILLFISFRVYSCNKTPYNFTTEQIEAALVKSRLASALDNKNLLVTSLYGKYNAVDFANRFLSFSKSKKTANIVAREVNIGYEYERNLFNLAPVFLKELLKPSESSCHFLSSKNRFYRTVSKKINKKLELSYVMKLKEHDLFVSSLIYSAKNIEATQGSRSFGKRS